MLRDRYDHFLCAGVDRQAAIHDYKLHIAEVRVIVREVFRLHFHRVEAFIGSLRFRRPVEGEIIFRVQLVGDVRYRVAGHALLRPVVRLRRAVLRDRYNHFVTDGSDRQRTRFIRYRIIGRNSFALIRNRSFVNYIGLRANIRNGGFRSHAEGKVRYLIAIDQPIRGERTAGQRIAVIGLGSAIRSEGQRHGIVNRSLVAIHLDGNHSRDAILGLSLFKASQEFRSRVHGHIRTEGSRSRGVLSHLHRRPIQVVMNGVRIFISRLVARVELDDLLRCVFNQVIDLLHTVFRQGISSQAGILIPAAPGIPFFLRQRLQRRASGTLCLNKRLCTRGFRRKGIRLGLHIGIYPGFLAVFYLVVLQCVFGGQVDTHGAIAQYIVKNRAVPTFIATQIGGNRVEYILVRIHRDLQVYHLALVKLEVDLIRIYRTVLGTTHIMGLHGDDALPNFIGIILIGIFRAYDAIVEYSPCKLALIVELDYISIRRNLSINSQLCLVPLIDVMVQSIGISRAANAIISIRQIALLQSIDQFIIDGRTHIHSKRFFVFQFILELILSIQYLDVVLHRIGSDLLLPLGIQGHVRFQNNLLARCVRDARTIRLRIPSGELIILPGHSVVESNIVLVALHTLMGSRRILSSVCVVGDAYDYRRILPEVNIQHVRTLIRRHNSIGLRRRPLMRVQIAVAGKERILPERIGDLIMLHVIVRVEPVPGQRIILARTDQYSITLIACVDVDLDPVQVICRNLPLGIQMICFCSALIVHAYALASSKVRTCTVRCRVPADELISRAFRKPRRLIAANGNYAVIDELGFFLRGRCRFGKVGMVGQFHSSRLTTPLSVQGNLPSRIGIFRCNQQLIARLVHISTAIRSGIPT